MEEDVALQRVQHGSPWAWPYGSVVASSSNDGRWEIGGKSWALPPECLDSATLAASTGSVAAFKLDYDHNTFLPSPSVLFCFYLILFSSAFLKVWWEEKDCTWPRAELQLRRGNPCFRSNACICHSENYFYLPINFMLIINKKTGLCVGSVWYFPAFTNISCFLYLPPCISRCKLFTLGYWLLRIKSDLPDETKQKGCIFFDVAVFFGRNWIYLSRKLCRQKCALIVFPTLRSLCKTNTK